MTLIQNVFVHVFFHISQMSRINFHLLSKKIFSRFQCPNDVRFLSFELAPHIHEIVGRCDSANFSAISQKLWESECTSYTTPSLKPHLRSRSFWLNGHNSESLLWIQVYRRRESKLGEPKRCWNVPVSLLRIKPLLYFPSQLPRSFPWSINYYYRLESSSTSNIVVSPFYLTSRQSDKRESVWNGIHSHRNQRIRATPIASYHHYTRHFGVLTTCWFRLHFSFAGRHLVPLLLFSSSFVVAHVFYPNTDACLLSFSLMHDTNCGILPCSTFWEVWQSKHICFWICRIVA